jgi:microcystin-dependent protein
MSSNITIAGENLIARKHGEQKALEVTRFVFALVPGLDPNSAVDRASVRPPAAQIVHTYQIPKNNAGYVNPNQVVYSAQIGSDVGDWDFNWVGLETAENVLLAVAYVPVQQKRKNKPPLQIGNNLTRNFMVAFSGAQAMTGVTIDASTWQHDFTVRLGGIDERERLSNRDIYGRARFFGGGLQVVKTGSSYQLKPGVAYIEGIRVALLNPTVVNVASVPSKAWLEVALQRQGSDVVATWQVVFGSNLVDKTDSVGARHYFVAIADLPNSNTITDLRAAQEIDGALIDYLAARNGDYEHLRARGTTKVDVGLGELPNAKSDDPDTNSSEILATTKALQSLKKLIEDAQVGIVGLFAMNAPPTGWLKANGAAVSRTTFARLFAKIGTTHGAGDGVTTFNLPDPRGRFPRFLDDGRGIDAGRVIGSHQGEAIQSHAHTGSSSNSGSHIHPAWTDAQGEHTHRVKEGTVWVVSDGNESLSSGDDITQAIHSYSTTTAAGSHVHNVGISYAGDHVHGITINPAGGPETRPTNTAFLACIKY